MKELVLYVDENGNPTGETEDKLTAHNAHTRKHLAFSCYVFNSKGELLVTKRADSKKVWPGVWSNSFCGHPGLSENFEEAIARRAEYELGLHLSNITCIKSDYSYETPPFEGITENEYCPMFIATQESVVLPNPDEVSDYKWLSVDDYIDEIMGDEIGAWSWWAHDQLKHFKKNPQVIMLALDGF